MGDDAAIIKSEGKDIVVTTDLLAEGVHFDLVYTPLQHLGYKAVVANLSDIYAMGGTPKQITVSLRLKNILCGKCCTTYKAMMIIVKDYGNISIHSFDTGRISPVYWGVYHPYWWNIV